MEWYWYALIFVVFFVVGWFIPDVIEWWRDRRDWKEP